MTTTIDTPNDAPQSFGPPPPDPALRKLEPFVGTWELQGRTLGAEADNISGRLTVRFLPGGYFLEQRIKLDISGFEVEGLEVVGYDPATGTFPSTVFPSLAGIPIPYRWEVEGDSLKITTDVIGATFRGGWSDDGQTFAGGWRPMPGRENDPGNIAYDIRGGRAAEA